MEKNVLLGMKEVLEEMGYTERDMRKLAELAVMTARFMREAEPDRRIRDGALYLSFMALENTRPKQDENAEYIG